MKNFHLVYSATMETNHKDMNMLKNWSMFDLEAEVGLLLLLHQRGGNPSSSLSTGIAPHDHDMTEGTHGCCMMPIIVVRQWCKPTVSSALRPLSFLIPSVGTPSPHLLWCNRISCARLAGKKNLNRICRLHHHGAPELTLAEALQWKPPGPPADALDHCLIKILRPDDGHHNSRTEELQ